MTTLTVDVDRTLAFPNTLPMIDTVRFINSDAGGVPMATLTLAAKEFDDVHFRSDLHLTGSTAINTIAITAATTLSLARWTFTHWTGLDAVLLTGTAVLRFMPPQRRAVCWKAGRATISCLAGRAKTGCAAGQDRIDLSAIAVGQHFIDGAEFGHVAGEVRFEGATHLLRGDLHGEGAADYEVVLDALPVLTRGDLILSAIRPKRDHVPATHLFNSC